MKTFYLPIPIRDVNKFLNGDETPISTALKMQQFNGLQFTTDLYRAEAIVRDATYNRPSMGYAGVGPTLSDHLRQPAAGIIYEIEVSDTAAGMMRKDTVPLIGDVFRGKFDPQTILHTYSIITADPIHDAFYASDDTLNLITAELANRESVLTKVQDAISRAPEDERRHISLDSPTLKDAFAPNGFLNASDEIISFGARMCRDVEKAMVNPAYPEMIMVNSIRRFYQGFIDNMGAANASPSEMIDIMDVSHAAAITDALCATMESAKSWAPERLRDQLDEIQREIPLYVADHADQELAAEEKELDE